MEKSQNALVRGRQLYSQLSIFEGSLAELLRFWSSSNLPRLPSFLKMLQNPHVLVTFQWMHNPLHLPHKTTSERPKCLRDPQFLTLLTSKCASRHNAVHFFDISTSKSAPRPPVFNTFYFQMCFAPQRRTLFRHLNVQKCSETDSF